MGAVPIFDYRSASPLLIWLSYLQVSLVYGYISIYLGRPDMLAMYATTDQVNMGAVPIFDYRSASTIVDTAIVSSIDASIGWLLRFEYCIT